MSNEIKTNSGRIVGTWDGISATALQEELDRIRATLKDENAKDRLVTSGIPHRGQLPKDLHKFNAYAVWGCDQDSNCLCGARANRIVSVEDVRQYSMIDHH